jgi:NAD(P)-dependent dehydrogenase (short-subunit alcohol dehydrogenase family)
VTHVLVTGGARGIGRALCDAARDAGWRVSCTLRGGRAPDGVQGYGLDLCDLSGLDALSRDLGSVDVLIHNAGILGPTAGPLDLRQQDFGEVMQVNALAPFAITQALLPNLRAATGARVLAISSQMAWMGYAKPDHIAYRMSKVALNKGMQGLATLLAPEGIAVACIDPGWVRTEMGGPEADRDPDDVARQIIALVAGLDMTRSGRFLQPCGTQRDW